MLVDRDADRDVISQMRKGKIITIYDIKIVLGFSGKLGRSPSSDEQVTVDGTVTIPELMHDADEDDLVFDIEVFSESKEKSPARDLIKSKLVPQLRTLLLSFPEAMRAAHGKDVLIAFEQGKTPSVGTAANAATSISAAPAHDKKTSTTASSNTTTSGASSAKRINTSDISESYEFQATAKELYLTFIDKARVAAWSRAPPDVDPVVGGKFSLFHGNVSGVFQELEDGKRLVQTWRLKDWPESHHAKLTLLFDQGLDGTSLRVTMEGVPIGAEDAVKSNFVEYYIKPIKQTFGFGAIL